LIVISGALVLVAAVLLVLGIISSITLVYAAIGLSIVSAVFLLVGVFQRPAPASDPHESDSERTRRQSYRDDDEDAHRPAKQPARMPAPPRRNEPAEEPEPVDHIDLVDAEDDGYDDSDAGYDEVEEVAAEFPLEKANADFEARSGATGADVLVISGRPRYHVGGCEYIEGNDDSEPLEINEARELGFTPCGSCRPNETLARSAAGKEHAPAPKPSPKAAVAEPDFAAVSEPETPSFEPAPVTVAAAPVTAAANSGADSQQNHRVRRPPARRPAAAAPEVSEPVAYAAPPAAPAPRRSRRRRR